ncbi:hypothetical protein EB796_000858 [Bugula neritina]|uniref:Uncharacterized protein n=1 Tax=Bugula neritina TaxID=10212 RepID=A0A7J7KRT9_BUGNE|nr:hypothetical protein EB796_000858 [Bugula neritina]
MHEMNRYRWAVLGLCGVHWKNIGKTTTEEGHTLYFSGEEDKHLNDVGFLIHKDIMNTIMGCRPISSRLITSHLRAARFNITIIQAYAPTSDYDDQAVDDFYDQIQEVIDQTPKERYSHCAGGLECKGADVRSDHDIVMMTFRLHLKRVKKQGYTRMKFDLEKLKDPKIAKGFQATIGGKLAPLTVIDADCDTDMDTLIDTFNTAVTETASEIHGKHRTGKRPWVTADILDLCDKRR